MADLMAMIDIMAKRRNGFSRRSPSAKRLRMLNRRLPLHGLLAVLLALMAQLGIGASVPRTAPIAIVAGAAAICHASDRSSEVPDAPAPAHPPECLVCPLCVALHTSAAALIAPVASMAAPQVAAVPRAELPPPSTAPPATRHPPSQPRAPPITS
jgi:hypothetical protein